MYCLIGKAPHPANQARRFLCPPQSPAINFARSILARFLFLGFWRPGLPQLILLDITGSPLVTAVMSVARVLVIAGSDSSGGAYV